MTIPKSRVRTWTPKVRTGCRTCRKRRVKCDEAKPKCRRCQGGGFTCAGYDNTAARPDGTALQVIVPGPRSRESIPQLMARVPISMVGLTVQETAAVEFFQLRTISVLPGTAWAVSWECIIFQVILTYNEPGLVHALAALGAAHRADAAFSEGLPSEGREQRRLSLVQSNKAMHNISRYIETNRGNVSERRVEIILLAALLFFSLEMLQGHHFRAWIHLRTGKRIICEQHRDSPDPSCRYADAERGTNQVIVVRSTRRGTIDILTQCFVRLSRDPLLNRQEELEFMRPVCREPMPGAFSSLEEALVHFDCLTAEAFRVGDGLRFAAHRLLADGGGPTIALLCPEVSEILETVVSRVAPLDADSELASSITGLQRDVSAWMSAFDRFLPDTDESTPCLMARIESLYLHVWAETCRDADEMIIDRFQHCFEQILTLSKRLYDLGRRGAVAARLPESGTGLSSVVGTRLLQVLGSVVKWCRDSIMRRRFLELIRKTRVCGMMDNEQVADCLGIFVDMEEQVARSTSYHPPIMDLRAADIPGHARLLDIFVHCGDPDIKGDAKVEVLWVMGRLDMLSTLEVRDYTKRYFNRRCPYGGPPDPEQGIDGIQADVL